MEEQTPVTESVDTSQTESKKRSAWNIVGLIASRALLVLSVLVVIFTVFSTIMFNKDDKELSFDEENELGFFNYDDEEILEENSR